MTLKEKVSTSKFSGMTLNQIFNKYPRHKQSTIRFYYYNVKAKSKKDSPKLADISKYNFTEVEMNAPIKVAVFEKRTPSDLIKDIWQSTLEDKQKEQLVITISKWM